MGKAEKQKDLRVRAIRSLILSGEITMFRQIFKEAAYPKTHVATFLGTNNTRMERLITNTAEINVYEISLLSEYFEVEYEVMSRLISTQFFITPVKRMFNKKLTTPHINALQAGRTKARKKQAN